MANINPYQQQIQPESAPSVRQSSSTSSEAFGGGVAAAGERVGATLSQSAVSAMDKINSSTVTDARLQMENEVDAQTSQLFTLKGRNASGAPEQAAKIITDARDKVTKDMSAEQRQEFDRQTLRYQRGMHEAVVRHTQSQLDQWQQNTVSAGLSLSQSQAKDHAPDDGLLAVHMDNLENGIQVSNSMNGREGDDATFFALEQRTKFNQNVIAGRLENGDAVGAQRWAVDHAEGIDPTIRAPLMKQLNAAVDIADAQKQASDIMADCDLRDGHGGVNWTGVQELVEKIDKPQVRAETQKIMDENRRRISQIQRDDQAEGAQRLFTYLQENNKTILDVTPADASKMNLPPSLVETIMLRQYGKPDEPQKEPETLVKRSFDLLQRIHDYDASADKDKTAKIAIDQDILRLHIDNATAAHDPTEAWNEKINPDSKLSTEMKAFLYAKGPKGKPGGLVAQISKDVNDSIQWHVYQPSTWGKKAPTPTEVNARVRTIMGQVKTAIHANPDWTPDDVADYYQNNPAIKTMRADSMLGHWKAKLTGAPAETFSPTELIRKSE